MESDAVWAVGYLVSPCELQKEFLSNMGLSGSNSTNFVDDEPQSARELHEARMAELRRRQQAAEIRQVCYLTNYLNFCLNYDDFDESLTILTNYL